MTERAPSRGARRDPRPGSFPRQRTCNGACIVRPGAKSSPCPLPRERDRGDDRAGGGGRRGRRPSSCSTTCAPTATARRPRSGVGEGLRAIEVRQPDVVLLDLMLEDGNGLELLDRVRSADGLASRLDPELPVIVLSGRTGETDRVRGFARGCDDYVGEAVLLSRAARAHPRAPAPRRRPLAQGRRCASGPLVIDPITRRVQLDGQPVHLSAKEFSLLQTLALRPDRGLPEGAAPARRLGLRLDGEHAHARRARVPAAQEARRARRGRSCSTCAASATA